MNDFLKSLSIDDLLAYIEECRECIGFAEDWECHRMWNRRKQDAEAELYSR